MNIERMKRLRRRLRRLLPSEFDMADWGCCVASHARALAEMEAQAQRRLLIGPPWRVAQHWLGLDPIEADRLFIPEVKGDWGRQADVTDISRITAQMAANEVDRLIRRERGRDNA